MALYKILLVEDEDAVRSGVRRQIPWSDCGFEIAAEANNGMDALDLVESLQPDLMITDIRMPFMDGIELSKKALDLLPELKIIFVTGYDEFDYAKEAVHLGVVEYVVKPVDTDEMEKVLRNVKEGLDQEIADRRDLTRLRSMYEANLPVLREGLLLALLEGRIEKGHIEEAAAAYGVEFGVGPYVVGCLMIEQQFTGDDAELYRMGLAARTRQRFAGWPNFNTLIYAGHVYLFFSLGRELTLGRASTMLDELCRTSSRLDGVVVTAGIGHEVGELSQLHLSREGAVAALDYRSIMGTGLAISIGDIEPVDSANLAFNQQMEEQLVSVLRSGSQDLLGECVDSIVEPLFGAVFPYERVEVYLLEVVTVILRIARAYHISTEQVFEEEFRPLDRLRSFESANELRDWLLTICLRVSDCMRSERAKASNYIVDAAKAYVQENYRDSDFSVEAMCRHIGISPAYFSTLFKRETGQAFVGYLTDLRMNHARRLLDETELKTYLISERVGFSDANYFSFVFKKRFGISPTRYRNGENVRRQ